MSEQLDALDLRIRYRTVKPELTWKQRKQWIDFLRWMERRNTRVFI